MQLLLLYSDRQIIIPMGMATPEYEGEKYPEEDSYFTLRSFIERELMLVGAEAMYSPLFGRFMQELSSMTQGEGGTTVSHFANHPEDHLRKVTTDLVSESELLEYRPDQDLLPSYLTTASAALSEEEAREEEERKEARYLGSVALRACNSYKMALLVRLIQDIHTEIKQAQRSGDHATILERMAEINRLNAEKRRLSDLLGERTIVG